MPEPDDEREEEMNRSYQVGISVGLERAAKLLLGDATSAWRMGKDSRATILRDESKRFSKLAKKAHPGVPE